MTYKLKNLAYKIKTFHFNNIAIRSRTRWVTFSWREAREGEEEGEGEGEGERERERG